MFETGLHVGVEAEREAIYTAEIPNKAPARQKAAERPRINLQLSGARQTFASELWDFKMRGICVRGQIKDRVLLPSPGVPTGF